MFVNLNAGGERPSLAGVKMVERVLGPKPAAPAVALDAKVRASLAGTYGKAPLSFIVKDADGRLTIAQPGTPPTALTYRGNDRFESDNGATIVRFERAAPNAPANRLRYDAGSMYLTLER